MKIDQLLKDFWNDKERFADFFNTVMFDSQEMIRSEDLINLPETLTIAEITKLGLDAQEKYRDKVKLWKGTKLVILGIENQDKVNYAMPERALLYDALQYEQQRKELAAVHKKQKDLKDAEFLSGFSKTDRLYPVLTIVIYYGEDPWDGPRKLRDMVDVPEGLETLFNDYRMKLFEVRGNTGETFHNKDIRKILWNAEAIRTKQLDKVDPEFDHELVPYLAAFVNSEKLLDRIERKGGTMCTALNELIADSRTEGIQQGEDLFAQLITTLFSLGRTGDAERAASDKEYRKKLMEEFQITQ
jgi:hypothetical protein